MSQSYKLTIPPPVVLQPALLLPPDVLHQLRHQPHPVQHHVFQVNPHHQQTQICCCSNIKALTIVISGSESASEGFSAAEILPRGQRLTQNQPGSQFTV